MTFSRNTNGEIIEAVDVEVDSGEGMTEPVPPEATAVIPFALDRQVVVERDDSMRNVISQGRISPAA